MLIAQIEDGQIVGIAEPRDLFPGNSFPATGPYEAWMQITGCMFVYTDKPFDNMTQMLVQASEPYIEDGAVYTVMVVDLTPEEQDDSKAGALHNVKMTRNSYITRCNWTQLCDSGLPPEQVQVWADFRKAVRQVCQDFEDSDRRTDPVWPDFPDDSLDDYSTPWLSKKATPTPAPAPAPVLAQSTQPVEGDSNAPPDALAPDAATPPALAPATPSGTA